jgi:hypothetical protein
MPGSNPRPARNRFTKRGPRITGGLFSLPLSRRLTRSASVSVGASVFVDYFAELYRPGMSTHDSWSSAGRFVQGIGTWVGQHESLRRSAWRLWWEATIRCSVIAKRVALWRSLCRPKAYTNEKVVGLKRDCFTPFAMTTNQFVQENDLLGGRRVGASGGASGLAVRTRSPCGACAGWPPSPL